MWKKEDQPSAPSQPHPDAPGPRRPTPERAQAAGGRATIGPSITIRGDVSGEEDLLIEGRVEGSVSLNEHSVTVGREGRVKADLSARVVTVEGEVEGNLNAQDQVVLRASARVEGDITAPRVVLEDGASFRGLVDMGEASKGTKDTKAPPRRTTVPSEHDAGSENKEPAGADRAAG